MSTRFFAMAAARGAVVGATLAIAGLSPALAQGTPEQVSACRDDAFKFCSQYIPIVDQIEACLKANKRALSPACRAEFQPKTNLRGQRF